MINHCRTLLLNRDGNKRPAPTYYLEELVPAEFRAVSLPGWLKALHDTLVSPECDNAFANFRMWQYMKLLHSTKFKAYVYALDSRVTYDYDHGPTIVKESAIYTPLNIEAQGVPLYFFGEPAQSAQTSRLFRSWEVEALSASVVRSTSLQGGPPVDTDVTFDAGLSSPILMVGQNGFAVRIGADPLPIPAKWLVETFVKPDADLTELLDPLTLYVHAHPELFPKRAPFDTFGQLWNKEFALAYRMSGLLLAFAYHTEGVRANG